MSASFLRLVARLVPAIIVAIALTAGARATDGRTGDPISVIVDQATVVKLPQRIATLVVGNPLIADVSLQAGSTMVVTGKSYGSTNVMAIDRDGSVLIDRLIQVDGPSDKLVTVFRGVSRETYSCNPNCERRITLGDGSEYFKANVEQSGSLSSAAGGGAAADK